MQQLDKWNEELNQLSAKSYKDMDDKLSKFYKKSLKQLKAEIKNYIDNYETLSFSKRLEVESQIKVANQIDEILWGLEGDKQLTMKDYIRNEANNGYYGTFYALEGNESVQIDFGMLNENYIERLIEKKVAGKTLSKRLYEHRTKLANTVTNELLNGALKGHGYAVVAKNIGELTEASYKQALRIARTEGGRVQSSAKQRSYKEAEEKGIELEKRWLSTLDEKTRHSHQVLDGQTVAVDDKFEFSGYKAEGPKLFGVAALDINCRCTTIAIVNGMEPGLRKDNITKETIYYKNYDEWNASKDTKINIGKKAYSDYVDVLSKKYGTKDFSKLLGKMSDKEYEKLGVLDITDNEIEWINKPGSNSFNAGSIMSKTNMKQSVGEGNHKQFIDHLGELNDERTKALFSKYGDKLSFKDMKNVRAHASGSNIQLSQSSFDGGVIGKPLQTVYHEIGHAFDSLGLKALTGKNIIATGNKIKTKILRKTVEFDEVVSHVSGMPKYNLKNTIERDLWEHVNGKELPMYGDIGKRPRKKVEKLEWDAKSSEIYSKSRENFAKFEKEIIEKYGKKNEITGALSDIYESTSLTSSSYPFGVGHGKKYYKNAGMAETEFFAHVTESITTNKESFDLINSIFPNAVKTWENIVDDILKASD